MNAICCNLSHNLFIWTNEIEHWFNITDNLLNAAKIVDYVLKINSTKFAICANKVCATIVVTDLKLLT